MDPLCGDSQELVRKRFQKIAEVNDFEIEAMKITVDRAHMPAIPPGILDC